jgi:hypothetical protein
MGFFDTQRRAFNMVDKAKLDAKYLAWTKVTFGLINGFSSVELEEAKELVHEAAKEKLAREGIDISTLKVECVTERLPLAAISNPQSAGFLIDLKAVTE